MRCKAAGLALSAVASCIAVVLAAPAATTPLFFVLNGGTPSVAIVAGTPPAVTTTIPIPDNPTAAVLSRDDRFLYVLHDGFPHYVYMERLPRHPGRISIVDVEQRRVLKTVTIGPYASIAGMTRDGRYLICYARGKPGTGTKPPEGSVTVIDTKTGEVAFQATEWRWLQAVAWREDSSRAFVLGTMEFEKRKRNLILSFYEIDWQAFLLFSLSPKRSVLSSFAGMDGTRLAAIPLERMPSVVGLSQDQRWVYAADPGEPAKDRDKRRPGWIYVADAESGQPVTSYQIDPSDSVQFIETSPGRTAVLTVAQSLPSRLYTLDGAHMESPLDVGDVVSNVLPASDGAGTWFVGRGSATLVPPGADTVAARIRWRSPGDPQANDDPLAVIDVPKARRLLVTTQDHRLHVLDVKDQEQKRSIAIGSSGTRAAKSAGRVALTAAFIISPIITGAVAALVMHTPTPVVSGVAVGDDQVTAYATDPASNDLTMINTDTGAVLGHAPSGSGSIGLRRMTGIPRICGFARDRFTVIDTVRNSVQVQHEPTEGTEYRGAAVDDDEGKVYLLSDRTIEVWDPLTGKVVATLTGFSKPRALLWPSAQGTAKTTFFWKH